MLQLHYHPSDASLMPHIFLEELGVPFELKLVDRARNAQLDAVIGAAWDASDCLAGYWQEIRGSIGVARWTGNFTPWAGL